MKNRKIVVIWEFILHFPISGGSLKIPPRTACLKVHGLCTKSRSEFLSQEIYKSYELTFELKNDRESVFHNFHLIDL